MSKDGIFFLQPRFRVVSHSKVVCNNNFVFFFLVRDSPKRDFSFVVDGGRPLNLGHFDSSIQRGDKYSPN